MKRRLRERRGWFQLCPETRWSLLVCLPNYEIQAESRPWQGRRSPFNASRSRLSHVALQRRLRQFFLDSPGPRKLPAQAFIGAARVCHRRSELLLSILLHQLDSKQNATLKASLLEFVPMLIARLSRKAALIDLSGVMKWQLSFSSLFRACLMVQQLWHMQVPWTRNWNTVIGVVQSTIMSFSVKLG